MLSDQRATQEPRVGDDGRGSGRGDGPSVRVREQPDHGSVVDEAATGARTASDDVPEVRAEQSGTEVAERSDELGRRDDATFGVFDDAP